MHSAVLLVVISLRLAVQVNCDEVVAESVLPIDVPIPPEETVITEPAVDTEKIPSDPYEDEYGVYAYTVKDMAGNDYHLGELYGRVTLIVNVASKCGYTDATYRDMVALQSKFEPTGFFSVLAFPSNQFFEQEPGTNEEILQFATTKHSANFPIFAKVNVTGEGADEAWKYLARVTGYAPQWNFWKYLVDHTGHVIDVWAHETPAAELEGWIEDAISKAMPETDVGNMEDNNDIVPEENVDFSLGEGLHPESETIGINPDHAEL